MILVTGAAGKTGRAVIRALVKRGEHVRAFVYRARQRTSLRQAGAHEVIVGDMQDRDAFENAIKGVRALYHICPNTHPDEVEFTRLALATARTEGMTRFVYHSVLHPQTEAMPHHWHKLRAEALLFEAGINYTILQPAAYMQNIMSGWQRIVEQGIYQVPYPVETRLGMVDLEDVAAVAATVLTERGHIGAIYELAGCDSLSQTEVATILSQSLKRPVEAKELPLAVWKAQAEANNLGSYQIDTLLKMFEYYAQHGFWGNPNVLRWLLGREPTSFEAFVERVKR